MFQVALWKVSDTSRKVTISDVLTVVLALTLVLESAAWKKLVAVNPDVS